jgi:hypothetical protein
MVLLVPMNHFFHDIDDAIADALNLCNEDCDYHVRYNFDTESYHVVPHWVPMVDSDELLYLVSVESGAVDVLRDS